MACAPGEDSDQPGWAESLLDALAILFVLSWGSSIINFSLQANHYYKLFITWTSQKIKNTFVQRNMFEFKHIKAFDRAYIDNPGPMVVFATPGMLHAGLSLQIFRKWASNDNNMVSWHGSYEKCTHYIGEKWMLRGTWRTMRGTCTSLSEPSLHNY